MITLVHGLPPNWSDIVAAFPVVADKNGIVVTYGDRIYCRGDLDIPTDLREHETVHAMQQREKGPALWWERYLSNIDFRIEQELAAYRRQYDFKRRIEKDRNAMARFLFAISRDLASPIYGSVITHGEAMRLIRDPDS